MEQQIRKEKALKISWVTLWGNLLLSTGKAFAGIYGHSNAMISDAIHSASDVFTTFIVMLGMKIGAKQSDANHPYGHERFESIAALLLGLLLAMVGLGIGYEATTSLFQDVNDIQVPGILPLVAAIVSIFVKEWMYRMTIKIGKQIQSDAIIADAWHHRSDAYSSIGSLIGIAGARMGLPILDPLAGLLICGFILETAIQIIKGAMDKMVDHACDYSTYHDLQLAISHVAGVERIDDMKTRLFGDKIYVDVEISVNGALTLYEAHQIAEVVQEQVEERFQEVKHCMVHVNPML